MLVVNLIIQFHLILNKFCCIGVMNQLKNIFLLTQQINVQQGVITSLTVRNLVKSKRKILVKKNQLIIIWKTKKQEKRSQKTNTETCLKKKKTRLESIKEKDITK